MLKFLCWLGIHAWDYNKEPDEWFDYRQCKRCGRKERCLNLFGIETWRKVPNSNKKEGI